MKTEIEKRFEEVGLGYIPECGAMPVYLLVLSLADSGNCVHDLHWRLPDHYRLPANDVVKLKRLWNALGGSTVFRTKMDIASAQQLLEGVVNDRGICKEYRRQLDAGRDEMSRSHQHVFFWILAPEFYYTRELFYARVHGLVFRVGLGYNIDQGLLEVGMRVHESKLTRSLFDKLRSWVPRSSRYTPWYNEQTVGAHNDLSILIEIRTPELADTLFEQCLPFHSGSVEFRYVWSLKQDFSVREQEGKGTAFPAVALVFEAMKRAGIPVEAFDFLESRVF